MSRSINNCDTDWKREWEEEITLTPEEQKEANRLKAIEDKETAQILEDLHMLRLEMDREDKVRRLHLGVLMPRICLLGGTPRAT